MSRVVKLSTPVARSARTIQLESMFDLGKSSESTFELHEFPIQRLDERDWSIGLIVGPSGCGKTQTARRAFAEHWPEPFEWHHERAVVDEMSSNVGVKEVVNALSSVGFNSPPAWLRPYHLLSNGEKFRVEIARAILESRDITIVDEFTSVVDRQVAKIASHSVQKAVRARKQKFVAVSCHYDIEEWLQPDWVYQPANHQFAWRSLQRRPSVEVEISKSSIAEWPQFAVHHYLTREIPKSCRCLIARIDGEPVAFIGFGPLVSGTVDNAWQISRVVVMPDYQGLSLGLMMINTAASALAACGKLVYLTAAHPALVRALNKSRDWGMVRKYSLNSTGKTNKLSKSVAWDRMTAGFRYVGTANTAAGKLIVGGVLQLKK